MNPKKIYQTLKMASNEIDITIYRDGNEIAQTHGIATDNFSYMLSPFDDLDVKVNDVIFDGYDKLTIKSIGIPERSNGIWLVTVER